MENFMIPFEGGINDQCNKIMQNSTVIIHNQKNPFMSKRKKPVDNCKI